MLLAELGAEVIKIEARRTAIRHAMSGRTISSGPDSEYFQAWNLGKKSVTLISPAEGRRRFEALVKTADCVVNNLRGGTQPAKLGIDYAGLAPEARDRLPSHISHLRPHRRARRLAGLRLPDAGRGRPDGADRRSRGPPTRVGVSLIDR